MRWIAVMAPLLAFFSLGGCGDAPGAPWCAHYSTGNNDCSFYSFQQCTACDIGGSAEYALRTNVRGAAGKVRVAVMTGLVLAWAGHDDVKSDPTKSENALMSLPRKIAPLYSLR